MAVLEWWKIAKWEDYVDNRYWRRKRKALARKK
jgi:hypothetical protein